MYARPALACIAVARAPASDDDELPRVHRAVVVRLRSGRVLTGELRFVAPPERRRTTDHLNDGAAHFALHDGRQVYFVAKQHVDSVEEAA
jgi:hypothetical protein